jgi:predicted transcriptional regulator of viral defense system
VLHELSDVNPAKIHITVPRGYRIARPVPSVYVVHSADLQGDDIEQVNGIPVTTPARTIVDCCRAHLGPALIRQAIDDGVRRGLLGAREAERLQEECIRSP